MATVEQSIKPLVPGDQLTRDEFLRRWEAMPHVKRAELVGGIVYMPSPLKWKHGHAENWLGTWLGTYAAFTTGVEAANNATCYILGDAPQPDTALRILSEYGGQSHMVDDYAKGALDFIGEVCLTSTAYDLHQKLELYLAAGVTEYLTVLLNRKEIRWHRLVGGAYELLPASPEGIIRSVVFPGLWLHAQALLDGDMALVLATLQDGLRSPEHAEFVSRLKSRRS
jgi:hypothetical protein